MHYRIKVLSVPAGAVQLLSVVVQERRASGADDANNKVDNSYAEQEGSRMSYKDPGSDTMFLHHNTEVIEFALRRCTSFGGFCSS